MPPDNRPRLTLRLTANDVGRRVLVRRKLPDGKHSDTIGTLEAWDDTYLSVRRRDGTVVHIERETVVAGKPVPPPPPRRRPRGG